MFLRSATPSPPRPGLSDPRPGLGIAYMAAGMFLFAAVDAQAKLITESFHPVQIAFTRQAGLLVAVLAFLLVNGGAVLKSARPGLQILRGAIAGFSPVLFITAVAVVPLAEAVTVAFVAPFIVTLMAGLLLREPVGWRRWVAVSLGFMGALIVVRPGYSGLHPAIALVFIAAALFAVRQIMSRALTRHDSVGTTVAYTALASAGVLAIPLPFVWIWPATGHDIAILIAIAVLAGGGELLVIKALEVAQAVVVAPLQYTLLIWGTLYGALLFGDWPDGWTLLGGTVIVLSGLYSFRLERQATRSAGNGS